MTQPPVMTPASPPSLTSRAMVRYRSGYQVAKFLNTMGFVAMIIGLVLVGLGILLGLLSCAGMASQQSRGALGGAILFPLSVALVAVGLLVACLGLLVRAQAQITLAALDSAVYACPYLSDDARAAAIRL